jgi:hypothetical protein
MHPIPIHERLYSSVENLDTSRWRVEMSTLSPGSRFPEVEIFLHLISSHDLGPKPTLADLLRIYLAGKKGAASCQDCKPANSLIQRVDAGAAFHPA